LSHADANPGNCALFGTVTLFGQRGFAMIGGKSTVRSRSVNPAFKENFNFARAEIPVVTGSPKFR
jgi:hypothetical protein